MSSIARPTLVLRAGSGRRLIDLPELWRFRDLLRTLAGRDLKLRYRQTALGVIWDLVQALVPAAIFSLVFNKIARVPAVGGSYFAYAYTGTGASTRSACACLTGWCFC